jgi:PAS domain S-box-containing protein
MYPVQISLLSNVLSAIDDGALMLHNGEIICMNNRAEEVLSVQEKELIGKDFCEIFKSSDSNLNIEKLIGSNEILYFPDKNGSRFYAEAMNFKLSEEEDYVLVKLFPVDLTFLNPFTILEEPRELPLGLLVTNIDGLLIYADEQFLQLTNLSEKNIQGKNIADIFPLDSFYLFNYLKSSNRDGSAIVRINCKNSEERFLHANILHMSADAEKYYWLFSDPIDSLEITKELQQKEQYLSSIFRAAPVGIGVLHNNTIIYVNKHFSNVAGYEVSELMGSTLELLFVNKTDYEQISEKFNADQLPNNLHEQVVNWKTKSGQIKIVQLNITLNGIDDTNKSFTLSVFDITESKLAQDKLRLSETRYRKLIHEAADSIVVFQLNKGLILEVNQKMCSLTGYLKEELIGCHISILFPKETSQEYLSLFVNEEWTLYHPITKTEILSKDNELKQVEINNCILEDEPGKVIIGFYRDLSDRRLWEIKLTESERKYKTLFNSVKEGIVITDISSNTIQLVNSTVCNWFGYTQQELTGKIIDFLICTDGDTADKLQNLIAIGDNYLKNVLCTNKDSGTLYLDIRSSVIQIDSKNYCALYLTNITERYQQQLHLEKVNQELIAQDKKYKVLNDELKISYASLSALNTELERKTTEYQQLFNEMVSGFSVHEMIYDENGKPIDYRFISVNPAFEKLTGLKVNDVIGKTVREVMPNIEEYWIDTYGRVVKTGIPVSYQNYSEDLGKYYEVVAYSPEKDIFAVVFNDITLREISQNELKKIFNLSIDFICIADLEGHFIKVNPTFQTTLGYTEEELLSSKITDFIFESDRIITYKVLIQELSKSRAINNFQNRFIAKDGRIIWISWTAQPLVKGKTIFAIGHNITEQKKAESDLIEAKEKAIESDRLKSAFLANMSHEIRTPMNAIIGFSSLLDNSNLGDSKRKKYTHIIRSRCDDLLRIIDDILDISRIEAGQVVIKPDEFILNELLQEIYVIHKQRILNVEKNNLTINLKQPPGEIRVFNDRQRLLQVMNNLLDNAIKFTNEGKIEFGFREYLPDKILFYVSDTGIGIPKNMHNIIFQRFRQAEENLTRKFGGNGLGLAISKPLIQLMGGNIWLESELDKGATFYFTINKFLGQQELINLIKLKDQKILVVEDDRHSVEYFRILLEQLGASITHVHSGNECLSLLQSGAKFDIILMDIQLPDISGIEITKAIRKFDMEVPIIAETAYAQVEDRKDCLDAGCNDFIAKPVDDETLIKVILKYIDA